MTRLFEFVSGCPRGRDEHFRKVTSVSLTLNRPCLEIQSYDRWFDDKFFQSFGL